MMSARAISIILYAAVCSSAILGNVKANKTVTPTAENSLSTEYIPLSPNTTGSKVEETTLHPNRNSSFNSTSNYKNATTLYSPKPSHVTTPPFNQSSLNISSVTATLASFVTVPTTRQINSSDSKVNNSTVITTNGYSQNSETVTYPMETNTTLLAGTNSYILKYSETILTSVFSTILIVVTLTILGFSLRKYRRQRSQYSHHPLHESSYESANGYSPPDDDTLVISGGLYDAPRIYNPNMTVLEEEDSHPDYVSFSSRPGQYRLEFLPDDKNIHPALRNV